MQIQNVPGASPQTSFSMPSDFQISNGRLYVGSKDAWMSIALNLDKVPKEVKDAYRQTYADGEKAAREGSASVKSYIRGLPPGMIDTIDPRGGGRTYRESLQFMEVNEALVDRIEELRSKGRFKGYDLEPQDGEAALALQLLKGLGQANQNARATMKVVAAAQDYLDSVSKRVEDKVDISATAVKLMRLNR